MGGGRGEPVPTHLRILPSDKSQSGKSAMAPRGKPGRGPGAVRGAGVRPPPSVAPGNVQPKLGSAAGLPVAWRAQPTRGGRGGARTLPTVQVRPGI